MNDEQILALMREALNEVAPNREEEFEEIELTTTIEELALDSIATMEMVGYLEDKVEATFPDEQLADVSSIAHLAKLIRANKS